MAMTKGSVSVDGSGNVSGTGFAKELYDDFAPKISGIPGGAAGASAKQRIADLCNSIAKVIDHITAHAEVTVTVATGDAGLQRTPNPNNANTDTVGPSGNKTLATKGTVA